MYRLNELSRINWNAVGTYQARQGKTYIERYVSCERLFVSLGRQHQLDAEHEVLAREITLTHLHSMSRTGLKECQIFLQLLGETQTMY